MKNIFRFATVAFLSLCLPATAQVDSLVGPGAMPVPGPSSVLRVYLAANQAVTDSTQTTVKFDTKTIDTQNAYATGTGLATFTKAGNYLVCTSTTGQALTTVPAMFVYLLKSGTIVSRVEVGAYSAGTAQTAPGTLCDIVNVNGSSDTIGVAVYIVGTGGSDNVTGSSTPYTFLSATYLGL